MLKALLFASSLLAFSTSAYAQQQTPLTCWYNEAGRFSGADTGNPAGILRDFEIRPYRSGDYAYAMRLNNWSDGNDCPQNIDNSPDTGSPSSAVNWTLPPTFGGVKLIGGFEETVPRPDPYQTTLTAGGSIAASSAVRSDCLGMIAQAPDFDLFYESTRSRSRLPLIISSISQADTTLVINAPNGQWYCDDDSGGNLNASIRFNNPDPGLYNIWVGTYEANTASAVLKISEHVNF